MMLDQAQHQTTWTSGDFNHDSQINADDWTMLAYAVAYSAGQPYSAALASPLLSSAQAADELLSSDNSN